MYENKIGVTKLLSIRIRSCKYLQTDSEINIKMFAHSSNVYVLNAELFPLIDMELMKENFRIFQYSEKIHGFLSYYGRMTERCADFICTLAMEASCEGCSHILQSYEPQNKWGQSDSSAHKTFLTYRKK